MQPGGGMSKGEKVMYTGKSKHRYCLFSLGIPFCDLLQYEMSEEKKHVFCL